METSTPAYSIKPASPVAQKPVAQPIQQTQPQIQAGKTITASDGTVLDAGVVNLAKAIRQQESGGNYTAVGDNGSSHGAYQWNEDHFAEGAKQFGLDPTDFSPVNQDKVAYAQIDAYKKAGYSPEQIASIWNSGKPDATGNKGTTTINGKTLSYDTPAYVQGVMASFNQNKTENPGNSSQTAQASPAPEASSLMGFAKNTVESGANFLGNIGDAVLHPIQTVQNIGDAAVGGLQELGGQSNDNTAKFDNLVGYFKQRYGGVDNLLHTAYTDPVGLAGDISAALGVGGGIAGIASQGAEAAGLGQAAIEAGGADFVAGANGVRSTAGSGVAGALDTTASGLNKASELTNPLTPVVKGAGAMLDSTKKISDIIANPQSYTPEEMANSTRANVAQQVEDALQSKIAEKGETGDEYDQFKEAPTPIEVTPDGLDSLIRKSLGVDITDGVIKANSTSEIRDTTAIAKLQSVYNTYKGDFLNGTMDSEKFLNLRSDLGDMAYNDSGIKNTKAASAAEQVRNSLNSDYRSQIAGLSEKDAEYTAQSTELKKLRKGFLDKDGNLLESATNKIANSLGKGKDAQLARLEEIVPGIGRKLEVMKTLEDIAKGSFTSTIVEKGGIVGGLISGNVQGAALAFASIILSNPKIAIPLMRVLGNNIELVKSIMANLAKFTTLGITGNGATAQPSPAQPIEQTTTDLSPATGIAETKETVSPSDLNKLASDNSFDLDAARKAGYSDSEIKQFLDTQKS